MKRALLLIPAALFTMGAASSETMFDGTYAGIMHQTPGMAGPACSEGMPMTATVKNGRLSAPQLNGTVNIKAFVQGKLQMGARALPIEGRVAQMDDGTVRLSAGLIDDQANCGWTMDLAKVDSSSATVSSAGRVDLTPR